MTVFEMQGVLLGKAIPGDIKVNESLAEYLVRKFTEKDAAVVQLKQQLEAREREVMALTNECAVLKSLNSALCDELRGYETDNEDFGPNPQSVALAYSTETPTTDAALAAVEARGVEKFADAWDSDTAKIMEGPFFYGQIEQREAFSKCVRAYLVELREGRV